MTDAKVKKRRFKLSPELVDGDHWTVVDTTEAVIDAIEGYFDNDPDLIEGGGFSVRVVEMSDEEVAALPEI